MGYFNVALRKLILNDDFSVILLSSNNLSCTYKRELKESFYSVWGLK